LKTKIYLKNFWRKDMNLLGAGALDSSTLATLGGFPCISVGVIKSERGGIK
jgi:hypothetical protein